MNNKTILLYTISAVLLVSCGPKKAPPEQPEQTNPPQPPAMQPSPAVSEKPRAHGTDTSLMYPEKLSEKEKNELTPEQQKELQIHEDNVMNPFPG